VAYTTKPRKPSPAHCALCHRRLHGVPRRGTGELAKLSRTEKRPERAFGGTLCANCTRDVLVDRARLQSGVLQEADVPLTRLRYVRMLKG
jgi:large subunit ribosomal protein L34e